MCNDIEKTTIAHLDNFKSDDHAEDALVQIYPPGPLLGKKWSLGDADFFVGRDSGCQISIPRQEVSRRHARLSFDGTSRFVEDAKSTNGLYVNNVRIARQKLNHGDQIKIGDTVFKYLLGTDVENAYHEEIYRMTIKDGLTDIYNKRYFMDEIARETARTARYHRPLALIMFDIDHFKEINDSFGHLAGDAILQQLAQAVDNRIRKGEVFARYGGEEFAVLAPECREDDAAAFAEQLRRLVDDMVFSHDGVDIAVTISLGVAAVTSEALDPDGLIALADRALYRAKDTGRNRVMRHTPP